jgi:hypothetical protein
VNTLEINLIQRNLGGVTDITGVICLLLAVWFSCASGIPYAPALAQVTFFYQSSTLRLSALLSK